MPTYNIDETGRRYGKLLVEQQAGKNRWGRPMWLCRCDCGVSTVKLAKYLRNGETRSCGCMKGKHEAPIKHGLTRKGQIHYLYETWHTMLRRCREPQHKDYKNYGARGITVCERWQDFAMFVADMGARPPGHTLDRIDNDGEYSPMNCRWAPAKIQAINRRERQRNDKGQYC